MNRNLWIAGALALTLTTLGALLPAQAQPPNLEKARELVKLSGEVGTGKAMVEVILAQLEAEAAKVPERRREEFKGLIESVKKIDQSKEVAEELAKIYTEQLTQDEIDALIAFYKTPAGKSIAAKRAKLWAAKQLATQARFQAIVKAALKGAGMKTPEENLKEARQHGNEAAAIGGLKAISSAQTLFREGDKDGNNRLDYAEDLAALGKCHLIDRVLASGKKQGYSFEVCRGEGGNGAFVWMAVADPIKPSETGNRYFATNHTGVIFYRTDKPFTLDTKECKVTGGKPLGK